MGVALPVAELGASGGVEGTLEAILRTNRAAFLLSLRMRDKLWSESGSVFVGWEVSSESLERSMLTELW